MKKFAIILILSPLIAFCQAPFNITVTNFEADQILKGNYDPSGYLPSVAINHPDEIACSLNAEISSDSLHSYLLKLSSFHNRNTYADTVSNTTGIGAARRWIYSMFEKFSSENENRLIPSYLQFEMDSTALCGSGQFRNIFAVLPGNDTSDKSLVIIEAHIDSRCEDVCDINCLAEGADDNGSGTALVLELARVLSRFSFPHTIVFLVTIGEEQGLYGADAFATYADDNGIIIKAVQNNDIVGGIICGETSSSPGCPAVGDIDSTELRIFSLGNLNSPHKNYARYIKMMYTEWVQPLASVPMTISIMQPEDRTGRGGDHIPFRQKGYTAVRFTSADENGNGNPDDSTYHDRQHSSRDILGIDTNGDLVIDSFFVDCNYLARNTIINGIAAAMCALELSAPSIQVNPVGNEMRVAINDAGQLLNYRIGIRTTTNDFNVVYTLKDSLTFSIPGLLAGNIYKVSAASVNSYGVMSLFSNEVSFTSGVNTTSLTGDTLKFSGVDCISLGAKEVNHLLSPAVILIQPNPFSYDTRFIIKVNEKLVHQNADIIIWDIFGRNVKELPLMLERETSTIFFNGNLQPGIYWCSLQIAGVVYQSRKIIIAR